MLNVRTINTWLDHVRDEPKFETWRKQPDKFAAEIGEFLGRIGHTADTWASFVPQFVAWLEEAKLLAQFTLTYGFPPATDERTIFLLTLAIPYARKYIEEGPEPTTEEIVFSKLQRMMA